MSITDRNAMVCTQIAYFHFDPDIVQQRAYQMPIRELLKIDKTVELRLEQQLKKGKGKLERFRAQQAMRLYGEVLNEDPGYNSWIIRDIKDDNENSGLYACLIELNPLEAVVAFRGSESYNEKQIKKDWIDADIGLLKAPVTIQQIVAEEYLNYISETYQYSRYYITGHSLGSNLAAHSMITAPDTMRPLIEKAICFDGPGFSQEYLEQHKEEIKQSAGQIFHYCWSLIGCMLYPLPGTVNMSVRTHQLVYEKYDIEALTQKHDTSFLIFTRAGAVLPGKIDYFAEALGKLSRAVDESPDWIASPLVWCLDMLLLMGKEEKRRKALELLSGLFLFTSKNPGGGAAGVLIILSVILTGYIAPDFYEKTLVPAICKTATGVLELTSAFQQSLEKSLEKAQLYLKVTEKETAYLPENVIKTLPKIWAGLETGLHHLY